MKNVLPLLCCFIMALNACKKQDKEEILSAKANVTFKLSALDESSEEFDKTKSSVSSAADTLKAATDFIYYRVYRSNGSLLKTITQQDNSDNYGTLQDSLYPGTYTIYIIASKVQLTFQNSGGEPAENDVYASPSAGVWGDIFMTSLTLTVGGAPITQNVRLERAIGGLELELKDAIPEGTTSIELVSSSELHGIRLKDALVLKTLKTHYFPITLEDIGKTNKKFFVYSLNSGPITIRVMKGTQILLEKAITVHIGVPRNKIVRLSGSLFTTGTPDFDVVVNPAWKAPRAPIPF